MKTSLKTTVSLLIALIALPAAAVEIPQVETFRLSNGLTVLMRADTSVPLVAVELRSRAGSQMDPAGIEGLASLTATLLTYGTPTRTEDQLTNEVALLGATLSAASGLEAFYVGGSVPTIAEGALHHYLRILADVMLNPTFPGSGFENSRNRTLAGLKGLADEHSALADLALARWMYGDKHSYGRATGGTLASVAGLTGQDVVGFHRRFVVPDDAVIGLSGDFDPKVVRQQLESLLGNNTWGALPDGQRRCRKTNSEDAFCDHYVDDDGSRIDNPQPRLKPQAAPTGVQVLLVDTGDPTVNQAQFRLGVQQKRKWDDPQLHAFYMVSQILGGDFTARINTRLRIKEGLTYGARYVSSYDDVLPSSSYISSYVSPKDVTRALNMTLEEIVGVRTQPIAEEELARIKSRITNGFVFRFETSSNVLSEYLDLWQDRLDASFLASWPDKLDALTTDQLKPVLDDLPSTDYWVVVVGNQALKADLEAWTKEQGGTLTTVGLGWLGLR